MNSGWQSIGYFSLIFLDSAPVRAGGFTQFLPSWLWNPNSPSGWCERQCPLCPLSILQCDATWRGSWIRIKYSIVSSDANCRNWNSRWKGLGCPVCHKVSTCISILENVTHRKSEWNSVYRICWNGFHLRGSHRGRDVSCCASQTITSHPSADVRSK